MAMLEALRQLRYFVNPPGTNQGTIIYRLNLLGGFRGIRALGSKAYDLALVIEAKDPILL